MYTQYVGLNISQEDHLLLEELAKSSRRRISDIIRIVLEDLASGKIQIEKQVRPIECPIGVRIEESTKQGLVALKESTGKSINLMFAEGLRTMNNTGEPL